MRGRLRHVAEFEVQVHRPYGLVGRGVEILSGDSIVASEGYVDGLANVGSVEAYVIVALGASGFGVELDGKQSARASGGDELLLGEAVRATAFEPCVQNRVSVEGRAGDIVVND